MNLLVKKITLSLAALLILTFSGCVERKELGSSENPIKFSLVPGQDTGVLTENGNILSAFLEKETGLKFQIQVPNNFIAVVETFGTKRTDMAMMNSFGYILAHQRYGARVRLVGTNQGRADYWGQVITANKKIKKMSDIKGKKFAYVDPASTSGYILPSSLFKKMNIEPAELVFAGKHDSVVTMVYQKQVDAGATFHTPEENGQPQDARKLVKTQFPDVFKKVRVLELIGPIPSDPVVFSKDLPPAYEEKIVAALLKFSSSKEGEQTLKKLYNISGFAPTTDQRYDTLRNMLQQIGKTPEDFVK